MGKDKSKIDDVLFMFEKYFKPTHLYSNHGTNLVLFIQPNVKTKLNLCLNYDVANDCSFANKDEKVTFLFFIQNTNERVKDQLIEKMKTMDILTDNLQLAKTVESMVQMETLSKQLLQNDGKLTTITKVDAVQKCHHSKNKCFQSISKSTSERKSTSWDKGGKNHGNCGHSHLPKQCPAYDKESFKCKKKNHFPKLCQSSDKSQVVGLATPNVFQGKTFMKWKK